MKVMPFGDEALLVEPDNAADVQDLLVFAAGLASVRSAIPGAETVLVVLSDAAAATAVRAELAAFVPAGRTRALAQATVQIPVRYDGEDLREVAALSGLSIQEVIEQHSGARYQVAFCGFAPGFAYLTGLPSRLQVPRLASPRTLVPAGAVAVAARFSAVYPRPSPGGWRLLGHTDLPLWNTADDPPALLCPGMAVRFRPL